MNPQTAVAPNLYAPAIPAPTRRDPGLDGLRGLAVLMVFVFHYGGGLASKNLVVQVLGNIVQASWIGIVLFFALSGFLITGSIWDSINEKFLLRNYFIRRALRILPLYLIALLISFLSALSNGLTFNVIRAYLIHLFFLQDIPFLADYAVIDTSAYPIYHLWSLAVEEQFYLLWPILLLKVDNRRGARTMCLRVFAFSFFFRLIFSLPDLNFYHHGLYDHFLFTHVGALALGGASALALRSRDSSTGRIASPVRFLRKYSNHAFFVGLAVYIAVGVFKHSFLMENPLIFLFGLPAASVSCAALLAIVLSPGSTRRFFSGPVLGWFGRISYGFYIFHILLQPWFDKLAFPLTLRCMRLTHWNWSQDLYQSMRFIAALVITTAVSAVSFRYLESPFLRLGRSFPLPPPLPSGLNVVNSARREPSRDTSPAAVFTPARPYSRDRD